jgi:toxin ParE1/3/4
MKRVVFSPQAARDLEAIADYIAAENPGRAITFIQQIRKRCLALAAFPESARRFPELGANAHWLAYRRYVILYRNLPEEISIERIIHGARDIIALVTDRD